MGSLMAGDEASSNRGHGLAMSFDSTVPESPADSMARSKLYRRPRRHLVRIGSQSAGQRPKSAWVGFWGTVARIHSLKEDGRMPAPSHSGVAYLGWYIEHR